MYDRESSLKIGSFDDSKVGQEFCLMLKSIERNLKIDYLNRTDVIQYAHSGERISIGKNKTMGEKILFKLKEEYFDELSSAEKKYMKSGITGFYL